MNKLKFNHSPFIFNVWVPLNGWRFKDPYYIRLKDGRELLAFPNGASWSDMSDNRYEDSEVTHIKLAEDGSMRRAFTGGWRIARNIEYFGKDYPIYLTGYEGELWMDFKAGFCDPSTITDEFKIHPTRMYAYRSKNDPEKKVYLIASEGVLVDKSAPNPPFDTVLNYIDNPDFWPTYDDCRVISNAEILNQVNAILTPTLQELMSPIVITNKEVLTNLNNSRGGIFIP